MLAALAYAERRLLEASPLLAAAPVYVHLRCAPARLVCCLPACLPACPPACCLAAAESGWQGDISAGPARPTALPPPSHRRACPTRRCHHPDFDRVVHWGRLGDPDSWRPHTSLGRASSLS